MDGLLSAAAIQELLDDVDRRLVAAGRSASVLLVGGAAIALSGLREDRVTRDVDALTREEELLRQVAREVAADRGLPADWLNSRARQWMPPVPSSLWPVDTSPGLHVVRADDGFLLATKLVAQRRKDADDVVALAERLGLRGASPAVLEAHIRAYYTDPEQLAFVVDGPEVDAEVRFLAEDAARLLA